MFYSYIGDKGLQLKDGDGASVIARTRVGNLALNPDSIIIRYLRISI